MEFAEIHYMEQGERTWIKPFIKKLPKRLYIKYLMLFAPIKIEKVSGFIGEKVVITLPILKNEDNADLEVRLIKKAASYLLENKIDILINRQAIPFPCGFKEIKGNIAISFFMKHIINQIAKSRKIDLATAEIIVIDGENLQTKAVLNSIKEEVNYLWIQTTQKDKIKDTVNTIYEDCGLLVECFENPRNPIMSQADIVINCRVDMENFDYIFKRNSCYIDVSGFNGKLNRLMERRQDMLFTNNYNFIMGNEKTDAFGAEVYFLVKNKEFMDVFHSQGKDCDVEEIDKFFRGLNIKPVDVM